MRELYVIATGAVLGFASTPEEELEALWEAQGFGFQAADVAWR